MRKGTRKEAREEELSLENTVSKKSLGSRLPKMKMSHSVQVRKNMKMHLFYVAKGIS